MLWIFCKLCVSVIPQIVGGFGLKCRSRLSIQVDKSFDSRFSS